MHFYRSAVVLKTDVVAKSFHQENASAAKREDVFRGSRIGHFTVVESAALIGDPNGKLIVLFFQMNLDYFGFIAVVAVNDGIVNSFCDTDQNIAVYVRADAIAFGYACYPWFDHADARRLGRQFEHNGL